MIPMRNKSLLLSDLAHQYNKSKILKIDNFLDLEYANYLHNWFYNEMDEDWWTASFKKYDEETKYLRRIPQNKELIQAATEACYDSNIKGYFSYIFDRSENDHYDECSCPECHLVEFWGSDDHRTFLATLVGQKLERLGEVFMSRYVPGQFAGPHHDHDKGKIGWILSLSKDWQAHHGGLLHLLEPDDRKISVNGNKPYGGIKEVVMPRFNRLTIFEIPSNSQIPHFVSQVISKVPANRISFTGWYN